MEPGVVNLAAGLEQRPDEAKAVKASRLASLDAFRGLTIVGMLLVNNIALDEGTPRHLRHAAWNQGIHFADLVFPWFLYIVGVAIPYSVAASRRKGLGIWRRNLRAVNRMVILVLLGCLIDSSLAKRPLFDLGVLQLIGIAYLAGALLYELPLAPRLTVAGALLVGHWAAIRFIPVPGVGAGVFTPDQNFVNHLNETYLGRYHLQGLFSVVPTTALVMLGSAAGDLLRSGKVTTLRKPFWLASGGVGVLLLGYVWSLDIPFNKPVWTSSYILYSAGAGSLVLGLFYLAFDVLGSKRWAFPLVVFGSNAIVAYVAPILAKVFILWEWKWRMPDGSLLSLQDALQHFCFVHLGRVGGGWAYTGGFILIWWFILLLLYRKGMFLRV